MHVENRIKCWDGTSLVYPFARLQVSISWYATFSMHSLSYFLVAAFAIFKISGASSSSYDPNVFSLDDSSIFAVGSENDQEADLFPEDTLEAEVAGLSFLEPDLGVH